MVFSKIKSAIKAHTHELIGSSLELAPFEIVNDRRQSFQARKFYGTNLGSWFVLEKWMAPSMYSDKCASEAEIDAVKCAIEELGVDGAREKWNKHYAEFIGPADWDWMRDAGVNAVRVPLGYWVVGGVYEDAVDSTPFGDSDVRAVYADAWAHYTSMIETAGQAGIGVLVDLHALPGGANADAHSGVVNDPPKFFSSSSKMDKALRAIEFIADNVKQYDNVIGIQIINEAAYGNASIAKGFYYPEAIKRVRAIDPRQQVVVSDGWDLPDFTAWAADKPGVLIDTHVYRCFSDKDRQSSPHEIIEALRSGDGGLTSHALVGEFSCVLDGQTWGRVSDGEREHLRGEFGRAQFELFKRHTTGAFFWSYKFEWGGGGEWGFREMIESGCYPRNDLRQSNAIARGQSQADAKQAALGPHVDYWNQNSSDEMEHWRYEMGFDAGWADAEAFFNASGGTSQIGQVDEYLAARKREHESAHGSSGFIWEWEHGYRAGLDAFAG
ncbi:glycoside hydrolase superfamily [Dipodascopsis tothii]|uniref:glycoside hydrolase superfamily n=1 Tax=Dipodascopsis tothii TaxID=44089 RepID=UPI0034CEB9B0